MKSFTLVLLFSTIIHFGCSEQTKATIEVAKQDTIDAITDSVGKGKVAMQMYRNRHSKIKKSLVSIKALKKSIKRKLSEKKLALENNSTNTTDRKSFLESSISQYKEHLLLLEVKEKKIISALELSTQNFESLKLKVEFLQEQIDSANSLGSISINLDSTEVSGEIQNLLDKMQAELDLAESNLEVQELNLDLN